MVDDPDRTPDENDTDLVPAEPVAAAEPTPRAAPAAARAPRFTLDRSSLLIGALLIVILVVGAYFRFIGQNWDDFTHLHPDERFLTDVVSRLEPVSGLGEYFDTHVSTLNPNNRGYGFYVYGTLPLFIVKAAAGITAQVSGDPSWGGYNGVQLVGRTVSALADLLSIVFIFLLGRRLYNRWVGLLAAALYAFAVLPIQLSHFWTMDASSNLPVVIAFWLAVRVLDDGGWRNYVGFGLAFGAAVGSRINVVPLAGVLVLASILRLLPAFEVGFPRRARNSMIQDEWGGLLLAGIASVLTFRIVQPYAFDGPSFFGILPNPDWWSQMKEVQRQVSGQVDFPPNHQWAGRIPYLFAWQNMVLWGMGLPLGLTAWLGWAWAGVRALRGRPDWQRHLLPVVWILVYFGWQGGGWVMSMRYYIPLYPFLILLAAWTLVTLVKGARRALQARLRAGALRYGFALGLLGMVTLLTLAWGFGFTRIYTRQLTRVQASNWILQNVPADYSLTIEGADGASRLINIGLFNDTITHEYPLEEAVTRILRDGDEEDLPFSVPFDMTVSRILVSGTRDPEGDSDNESVWFGVMDAVTGNMIGDVWLNADLSQTAPPLGLGTVLGAGEDPIFGSTRDVVFSAAIDLEAGHQYTLQIRADAGSPVELDRVALGYDVAATEYRANFADGAAPLTSRFTAPLSGTVSSVHAAYLGDPIQDPDPETLWIGLWDVDGERLIGETTLTADFSAGESPLGRAYDIAFPEPVALEAGHRYEFQTRAEAGAPITVAGSVIAVEGPWDDPIPWKVCQLPNGQAWTPDTPPGLVPLNQCIGIDGFGMGYYQGVELFLAAEDDATKLETLINGLDESDYLTISSNRFYDSLSRLPMRFPLTMRYYDALFSGELGFELVQTFQSTFTWGSFTISDQVLPTYDVPRWLNEFEAEEAFHVYDHPVVFVFHKTADYDPERVADILGEVQLGKTSDPTIWGDASRVVGVVPWAAPQASQARTALVFDENLRKIQYSGGTWSDLYDLSTPVNQSQVVAVIAWWGLIIFLGWLIWPTLFALLPALADRAYPVAKLGGLLVVSWLAWLGASLGLRTWSPGGILLAMGMVLAVSAFFAIRHRAALLDYLRTHWRTILIVEGLTLLLYLVFIGIRLGNPDLWDTRFGGEKPMDFAYLNGVLRSTVFPPINPWYAGGYINYYYYGFVLVGTPIKLLGLNPSVAYNLFMPTLFALTGMGAFSAAYNLAASLRRRKADGSSGQLMGSPWAAGLVGMLLTAVLGNLDDIRIILDGFARAGGGRDVSGGSGSFLPELSNIVAGIGSLFQGQALPIDSGWWLWNPTRVMNNTGNAINEMPFFSYLYGDPHAHGIALPLTLLVIVWLIHEVLIAARRDVRRSTAESFLSVAFGALAVFILRATNFADWVTYTILVVFGLSLAGYLRHRTHHQFVDEGPIPEPGPIWRFLGWFGGGALYLGWQSLRRLHLRWDSIVAWLAPIVGFFALGTLFIAPYSYWYATADATPQLWQGLRTPLWAYLDIHGVFLFLVVSLLIWDTGRYLRSIRVGSLVGRPGLVRVILIGLAWLAVIAIVVFVLGYEIAIIVFPLLFWTALLFLRPGQDPELRLVWTFVGLALSLTFVVDVMVWAGDIGRQNTVFKFYMQVWVLFGIAGGVAFAWLLRACDWWRAWARNLWLIGVTVLFTIAAMFPLLAIQGRWQNRISAQTPLTLDGMDYLQYATHGEQGQYFALSEDYAMIRWLEDNVAGTPVVLEAQTRNLYRWDGRIAIYTGLPNIIGWDHHQRQQRTLDPLSRIVDQRVLHVQTIYDTNNIALAWSLMDWYDVQYVVVGQLERVYYDRDGLDKFDRMVAQGMLRLVFEEGDSRIYQVIPDADWGPHQLLVYNN